MSRAVSRKSPLSDSDRRYLLARGLRTDVYPSGKSEEEEPSQSPEVQDDYDEWSAAELRAELKERGLSADGNKVALIERLRDHDESDSE